MLCIFGGDIVKKDFLKKPYKKFEDFLVKVIEYELEYFVLDAKYSSAFNYRMKKLLEQIENGKHNGIGFTTILFNTENEIAVINANIVARYISDDFQISIENYYKNASLNKVVKFVVVGNEKVKSDFIILCYRILYNTMYKIYKEIRFNKELAEEYKSIYFNNEDYEENSVLIIPCILILEDICRYLSIDISTIKNAMREVNTKKI